MATFKVEAPDGRSWTIDAPEGVSEAEAIAFAQEHADSWVDGARYEMVPEAGEPAAPAPKADRRKEADAAISDLDDQLAEIRAEQEKLVTRRYAGPTPALLGGTGRDETGPVTGMAPVANEAEVLKRRAELQKQQAELTAQREKLALGTTGQTVGGIGGALLGGGVGALLGGPAAPITGAIGAILGAAGGVAAGTHLWDIPQVKDVRGITDQEAADIIKGRVVESVLWDGAFMLVFGPGGRLIGKLAEGSKMGPALKAVAKESLAWDQITGAEQRHMKRVIKGRAAVAPEGLATKASTELGVPLAKTDKEATEALVGEMAKRSGGRIPTEGEMTGVVQKAEKFARKVAPEPFMANDQALARTAEDIRRSALGSLDEAGAVTGVELGEAVNRVKASAKASLSRTTGPVFERAAQQNVIVDMRDPLRHLEGILFRDAESGGSLLGGDRGRLVALRDALKEEPYMSAQAVQDLISGQKAALRELTPAGKAPGEFVSKVVGELVEKADAAYLTELGTVKDVALRAELLAARKLYRETMGDLYSDTMVALAGKNPEDVGRALTGKGTVTEIRELRKALERGVINAPSKAHYKGGKLSELGREAIEKERARIDAGLVKGFIEKNTQSLTNLEGKLRDPDFKATLKELLVGPGAYDPALGRKVLGELDKIIAAAKIASPEQVAQPGRVLPQGVGGVGAGTVAGGTTGMGIGPGAIATIVFYITTAKFVAKAMGTAMTTGNTGVLRSIERALALAPAAGKNVAAAEALQALARELKEWDESTPDPAQPSVRSKINANLPKPTPGPKPSATPGGDVMGARG